MLNRQVISNSRFSLEREVDDHGNVTMRQLAKGSALQVTRRADGSYDGGEPQDFRVLEARFKAEAALRSTSSARSPIF